MKRNLAMVVLCAVVWGVVLMTSSERRPSPTPQTDPNTGVQPTEEPLPSTPKEVAKSSDDPDALSKEAPAEEFSIRPRTVQEMIDLAEFTLPYTRDWVRKNPTDQQAAAELKRQEAVLEKLKEFPPERVLDPAFYREHLDLILWGPGRKPVPRRLEP